MEAKAKSCYKCGQEGHIVCCSHLIVQKRESHRKIQSRECPENSNGASGGNNGGYGSGSSGAECYRCGKVGHIARACPDASSSNNGYGQYAAFSGGQQKTW